MAFFQKKYFKTSICLLVIISLFLQSIPLEAKAFSFREFFRGLGKAIPQIELREDGWLTFGPGKIKRFGKQNPFSAWTLGSDQIKDFELPIVKTPDICRLRILNPEYSELVQLSLEERMALRRACSDFAKVQRAAAKMTYFAKKMFNKTDPLSECFFLKNCKSVCLLSIGTIPIRINVLEILSWFLPGSWIATVYKVLKWVKKAQQLLAIWDAVKALAKSIKFFIEDIFHVGQTFLTFFTAIGKLGAMLFKAELIEGKGAAWPFRNTLNRFGYNLVNSMEARSETLAGIEKGKKKVSELKERIRNAKGMQFLFQENSPKAKEFQGIIDDYLTHFETPQQLVRRLEKNGDFLVPEEIFVQRGQYSPCPDGKFVTGVIRTSSGDTGKLSSIRCSSLVGKKPVTEGEPECEEIDLVGKSGWVDCPDGKYVRWIRKNSYDKGCTHLIYCCNLAEAYDEGKTGKYKCENLHLLEDSWNKCPYGKFVNSAKRVDPDTHRWNANHAQCCPLGGEFSPEISYPSEKEVSCSVSIASSTIPSSCYAYCSEGECLLHCDERECEIEVNLYSNAPDWYTFRCPDNPEYWPDPLDLDHCLVTCETPKSKDDCCSIDCPGIPKNCFVGWPYCHCKDENKDCSFFHRGEKYIFHCPKKTCYVSYPQQIGTHIVSCPEIPGEVSISCSGPCTIFPSVPTNSTAWDDNWFWTFRKTSLRIKDLDSAFSNYLDCLDRAEDLGYEKAAFFEICFKNHFQKNGLHSNTTLLNKIENLKTDLSQKVSVLPIQLIDIDGVTTTHKYWTTTTQTINAESREDAEIKAKNKGRYEQGLIYYNWDNKTETFLESDLNPIIEGWHRILPTSDYGKYVLDFETLLLSPIINPKLDTRKEKLIEIEKTMEEAKGEAENKENFDSALTAIGNLKKNVESLKNNFIALDNIWYPPSIEEESSLITYVKNIVETKNISLNIASTIDSASTTFDQIIALEDLLIGDPGLSTSTREALEEIFALSPPGPLEEINQLLFKGPESIKSFVGSYNCPIEGNPQGFLAKIKCFEDDNEKTFEEILELLIFIANQVEELEESFKSLKKIIPMIRPLMDVPVKELGEVTKLNRNINDIINDLKKDTYIPDFIKDEVINLLASVSQLVKIGASETSPIIYLAIRFDQAKDRFNDIKNKKKSLFEAINKSSLIEETIEGGEEEFVDDTLKFLNSCLEKLNLGINGQSKEIANKSDCPPGWVWHKDKISESSILGIEENPNHYCHTGMKPSIWEIMDFFSFLLAIREGGELFDVNIDVSWKDKDIDVTVDFVGFEGLKDDIDDIQEKIENLKVAIEEFKKPIEDPEKHAEDEGGEKLSTWDKIKKLLKMLRCETFPAESVTDGKRQAGPQGGAVCPDIHRFFNMVDGQFALIRNSLYNIDLTRRKSEWHGLKSATMKITLWKTYPIKYESINKVYDKAETIKKKAQNLWALATALDYANQSCTCGKSYCKMPICISGVPLTIDPIMDAYCYLVYILRYPLRNSAYGLTRYLENEWEMKIGDVLTPEWPEGEIEEQVLCAGKVCGPDGRGGSCGTCTGNKRRCKSDGTACIICKYDTDCDWYSGCQNLAYGNSTRCANPDKTSSYCWIYPSGQKCQY